MVCGLRGVTKKPIRTACNLRKLNTVGAFLISQFRAFYVCNEMTSDFHYRLREDPPENHAILKYESTTTISDFAYILCGVIY